MTKNDVSIRHDNGQVVFVLNGDRGLRMPWEKAEEIARALIRKAREAEEYCKANQIIADNALMQRAGVNIGLSSHPLIKAETVKESLYNRTLRRALSGKKAAGIPSIQSRGVVGAPTIFKDTS